jgi:hypothetical protein
VTTAAAECRHADGEGESNGGGLERRGGGEAGKGGNSGCFI